MSDLQPILFWIFASATCLAAIAVVVTQNVVRMAFWLIVSLGSVAGLFFLIGADFVGATQLMIYVGGTVVLLIFGVMLTASGPYLKIQTSPAEGFLAAGVGILFLGMITWTVASVDWVGVQKKLAAGGVEGGFTGEGYNPKEEGNTVRPIGMALLGLRPDKDSKETEKTGSAKNRKLGGGYLLPFEIVSVHLLVVLIGAAYLARAKKRIDTNLED